MKFQRKVQLLVIPPLTLSMVAVVAVASHLFVSDFAKLAQKGAIDGAIQEASRVRSELGHVAARAIFLAQSSFEDFRVPEDRVSFIQRALGGEPFIKALSLYQRSAGKSGASEFFPVWRITKGTDFTKDVFERLDQNYPIDFGSIRVSNPTLRVAKLGSDALFLRMGIPFSKDAQGFVSRVVVAEVTPELLHLAVSGLSEFGAILLDGQGKTLSSNQPEFYPVGMQLSDGPARGLASQKLVAHSILGAAFETTASVGFGDLSVMTILPASRIEMTKRELVLRSALIGSGFLFFTLFLAILFSRKITAPILAMSSAVAGVGNGDFSVRVQLQKNKSLKNQDEIDLLARSFNGMAEKIGVLMKETAVKARMENELKTARVVQQRFFPLESFHHQKFELSGKSFPATECGGDWWNYRHMGDRLLIAIGDVTGHGASAALVTAAAYSMFNYAAEKIETLRSQGVVLDSQKTLTELLVDLNNAVISAAGFEASMTFCAAFIDLEKQRAEFVNASHPFPLWFRTSQKKPGDPLSALVDLSLSSCAALGQERDLGDIQVKSIQLNPGDALLFFTDGLTECSSSSGAPMRRTELVREISKVLNQDPNSATGTQQLAEFVSSFVGKDALLKDDITFALGIVPSTVSR